MGCNVVAIPYPGRGHVNPMMNLCKLLLSHSRSDLDLRITFVVTEEWLGFIGSTVDALPPGIRLATIPNVLPSELDRAADMPRFVGATQTAMEVPFERLVDGLDAPVNFIIADTFLNWAVEFGNRRNIPVASLWPMPATVFSFFYHFELFVRHGHHPIELSEMGNERVQYVPGITSIRLADIPSIAHMKDQRLLRLTLSIFSNISKAQYLLFTTVYEIEPDAIAALKQEFPFPVYTIGPAIPYLDLDVPSGAGDLEWLNSQAPSTVLYIALGSFLSVSSAQMDEIADGLRTSGVKFLWAARGDAARLQRRCGDGGRIVPWCDQLRVLCHASIGGFWTHCGWNSALEAIYAGVPVITFPIVMDQMTVRKLVVEDWGNGWDAKARVGDGNLLRCGEIAQLIQRFMDLESPKRKEVTARAKQLREATLKAVGSEGGSSKANLTSFLSDIMSSSSRSDAVQF